MLEYSIGLWRAKSGGSLICWKECMTNRSRGATPRGDQSRVSIRPSRAGGNPGVGPGIAEVLFPHVFWIPACAGKTAAGRYWAKPDDTQEERLAVPPVNVLFWLSPSSSLSSLDQSARHCDDSRPFFFLVGWPIGILRPRLALVLVGKYDEMSAEALCCDLYLGHRNGR